MATQNNRRKFEVVESVARKEAQRETGDMLPCLIRNAPSAFQARRFSLERLRKDYKITRRTALEMVLGGIIESIDRRPPGSETRPYLVRKEIA